MDTSLGYTRSFVEGLRSWRNTDADFLAVFLQAYNTALQQFCTDVPEAFIPDYEHLVLKAPIDASDSTVAVRLTETADRRVLNIVDTAGTQLSSTTLTSWLPQNDGTWDGSMHLEITDNDGQVHRRMAQKWWNSLDIASNPDRYYITLDRQWRDTSSGLPDALMTFRIYQPYLYTRADVRRILQPARIWDETRQSIFKIDAGSAGRLDMVDYQREVTGPPAVMYRSKLHNMPTPTEVPTVANDDVNPWVGPVQEGTFTFKFTYGLGYRDEEWQDSPGGLRDLLWESAPSGASASFNHASPATNQGDAIIITTTNVDAMLNFDRAALLREQNSGWVKRIYVARSAVRTAGAGVWNLVETSSIYYPLVDIRGDETTYTWTGLVAPDYLRRLIHSTGYYAWEVWPPQDGRYEVDFRVIRRPAEMIDDRDVPPLQPDAHACFLHLLLYWVCILDGTDRKEANVYKKDYLDMLDSVRSEYSHPGGVVVAETFINDLDTRRYGTYREETP